jgi:hypothetical protein
MGHKESVADPAAVLGRMERVDQHACGNPTAPASDTEADAIPGVEPPAQAQWEALSEATDGGLGMGYELAVAAESGSGVDDRVQIERDWRMAQVRIDELAEAGRQAIQRLVQEIGERAEGHEATSGQPERLAEVQALPDAGSYDVDHLAEAV